MDKPPYTYTLPNVEEMKRRLLSVSSDPDLVKNFYPYFIHYGAGLTTYPSGFLLVLDGAIFGYQDSNNPKRDVTSLLGKIPDYIDALIDNKAYSEEYKRWWRELGARHHPYKE